MPAASAHQDTRSKEVFALRKAGELDQALEKARLYSAETSEDAWLIRAYGWTLHDCLKLVLGESPVRKDQIARLLAEYRGLSHHERPGRLHSLVLVRAAQAALKGYYSDFVDFLRWWDPANFLPSDYEAYCPPNTDLSFPGPVGQAIKAAYKSVAKEKNSADVRWVAEFIGRHIHRFSDEPWFPYYHGKLLAKCGEGDEARPLVLPIVKAKPNEFWAWDCLADTFGPDQAEMRMACLCRALQCGNQKPEFMVNVHADLGVLLLEKGLHAEARFEIGRALDIRRTSNWTVPAALESRSKQPWYDQAPILADNKRLYEEHARKATALLMADADWRVGVVAHINDAKRLTAIKMGADDMVMLLHPQYPDAAAWDIGQSVRVAVDWDKANNRWQALAVETTPEMPDPAFCRLFTGRLEVNPEQRFAFVQPDGIYCSGELLQLLAEYRDGMSVQGMAILARKPQGGNYGWKAIRIAEN